MTSEYSHKLEELPEHSGQRVTEILEHEHNADQIADPLLDIIDEVQAEQDNRVKAFDAVRNARKQLERLSGQEFPLRELVGIAIDLSITLSRFALVTTAFHGKTAGEVRVVHGEHEPAIWVGDFCFDYRDTKVTRESDGSYKLYIVEQD